VKTTLAVEVNHRGRIYTSLTFKWLTINAQAIIITGRQKLIIV